MPVAMPVTPEAIVQAQLDAYNARDLERFSALFAADVELYRPPQAEPVVRGLAAVRRFYADERFSKPGLHAQLLHRAVLGQRVVDHERISGVRDEPFEMVVVFEVADGLIARMWSFSA
jgi:hypothetical protein